MLRTLWVKGRQWFRSHGRKISPQPARDRALFDAIARGSALRMRLALFRGADPNARAELLDSEGITPLMLAVWERNRRAVQILLKSGARLDAADSGGSTALHRAAFRGDLAFIAMLYSAGGTILARDKAGHLPKEYADAEGHILAVRLLDWLAAGWNLNDFPD
jgi:ankyrin repeat protein